MSEESVVYGCIKDMVFADDGEEIRLRRGANRNALQALPGVEDWPLLSREMFSSPSDAVVLEDLHTYVTHFGSSYKSVEYEWETWIERFEELLRKMYWVSATVHLETEFNGTHTFTWFADGDCHDPDSGEMNLRCEWVREGGF